MSERGIIKNAFYTQFCFVIQFRLLKITTKQALRINFNFSRAGNSICCTIKLCLACMVRPKDCEVVHEK